MFDKDREQANLNQISPTTTNINATIQYVVQDGLNITNDLKLESK